MTIAFAENLKKLRKINHLSQEELSNKLGLSRGVVTLYENAKNYPNLETMIKLCEIFNVSLDELILRSAPERGNSPAFPTHIKAEANQQQPGNNQYHLQKEVEYLTKTVAMQEREINTMRSYTARLEKELEKCEESLENGQQSPRQTG